MKINSLMVVLTAVAMMFLTGCQEREMVDKDNIPQTKESLCKKKKELVAVFSKDLTWEDLYEVNQKKEIDNVMIGFEVEVSDGSIERGEFLLSELAKSENLQKTYEEYMALSLSSPHDSLYPSEWSGDKPIHIKNIRASLRDDECSDIQRRLDTSSIIESYRIK